VAVTVKQVERYTYSRSFGTKRGSGNKDTPDAMSAVQIASGSDGEPYDGRLSRTVRWAGIRLTQLIGLVMYLVFSYNQFNIPLILIISLLLIGDNGKNNA